jgi:alpha-tubulin suppressor-like RCC1 family protein
VDIVDVACGYYHALFLTEEGRVFGTGQGAHFQNGLQSNALSPEEILKLRDSNVNKLAAGATHGFAFRSTRGSSVSNFFRSGREKS